MNKKLTLLGILAHPDDESLGMGGSFARYSNEGFDTYLICATRGERGRFGVEKTSPGLDIVGKTREKEVLAAAETLGIKEVFFLDYIDGDLDKAPHQEIIKKILTIIRKIRPEVVATFGPEGGYGHPDHIAISQFAGAAIVAASDPALQTSDNLPPHAVSKFYYMVWDKDIWDAYQKAFKKLVSKVDGTERQANPWPSWVITTHVDCSANWKQVWNAVCCHKTQMAIYEKLESLSEDDHKLLWGSQQFYRVFSTVNSGRKKEDDLFDGFR